MDFNQCMKNGVFFLILLSLPTLACDNSFSTQQLSLEQRIGQCIIAMAVVDEELAKDTIQAKPSQKLDIQSVTKLVKEGLLGGICFVGKSDPAKQITRTKYYQNISPIPLFICQDVEPGRVGISRLEFIKAFANNQKLGEMNDITKTYQTGFDIGQRCKQLGVHINFAPVADVNTNPDNPVINDRSFGVDPHLVAKHSVAFAQGLTDAGIIACAKHFPGHGDTTIDSHISLPKILHSLDRLNAIELHPFKELIGANIPAIMVGHLEIPALEPQSGLPSSLSKNIITELLQNQLGFKDLIFTDALDMEALAQQGTDGQIELKALLAGADMLVAPINVPRSIATIKKAVENGLIGEEEIDRRVQKILRIKKAIFHS